jgi:type I restriction enzyme M protein
MNGDRLQRSEAYTQEDLPLPTATPAEIFRRVRDYLAGRHLGATRDGALLEQVLLCLFVRLYLVQHGLAMLSTDTNGSLRAMYERTLRRMRRTLGASSLPRTRLLFDTDTLRFVDRQLSLLDLSSGSLDLVSDVYQCFRGSDARGQEGQFFTPPTAIDTLVSLVNPRPGERVIDPACGAGGFLVAAARHLIKQGVSAAEVSKSLFGVDKDDYLAWLARVRLSLFTLHTSQIAAADSLTWKQKGASAGFMKCYEREAYDVVLANPPFGARIVAAGESVRRTFRLAHRWIPDQTGRLVPSHTLAPTSPPQVLFLERCIDLVRPGGRLGIVVPESLISGKGYRHVVQYMLESTAVEAVIGMPEELFKTSGRGGTHTKTALLVLRKRVSTPGPKHNDRILMAEAEWCGHDSRGRSIPRNDLPTVVRNFETWKREHALVASRLGFLVSESDLRSHVLAPRAYDPDISAALAELSTTHYLLQFGELAKAGVLAVTTGDEVGKLAYGDNGVPFVRTSDISNWEIKVDPKHCVSREVFEALSAKQDVQPGDILMVKDGTYLIGTTAMITKYDTEIVFQSHLYKIRVKQAGLLDPYLLLAALSSPLVQRQIRAEVQTQDVIDSLGSRIGNLVLPIPRNETIRTEISQTVERIVSERAAARELARRVAERIVSRNTD